jgi:hypothetical protein
VRIRLLDRRSICDDYEHSFATTNMRLTALSPYQELKLQQPWLTDEQIIGQLCDELIDLGEVRPPVDVELLASLCGIRDVEYGLQPFDGCLFTRDGGLVARVSITNNYERQRFTVLHEGGHTLLPGFRRQVQHRCAGPKSREEQLCDLAAAELLLPRRFFDEDHRSVPAGLQGVELLARRYEASLQATAIRTLTFAERPTLLLVFKEAHKLAERGREHQCAPKLRLQWSMRHGRWPYPMPHKSVARDSAIARAWLYEQVDEMACIDEVLAQPVGPVRLSARRYGDHVIAMAWSPRRPVRL